MAGAKALAAAGDLARHQGEAENAAKDEERLRAAHDRLAGDLRLVTLAEAEGTIDVWGDAARLRSALTDAVRDAEQHALGEAVEAAEDDRLLNAVDSSGLLPAPVATRAAAETLTQAGIVAETAWAVLSRDFTAEARAGAAIRRPDVASGVVVQDDATRTRAVSLLASSPTLAHVPLTTAAELAAAAAGTLPDAALPTVPLHPGLHDHPAAATTADKLRSAGAIRSQRRAGFSRRADSDRAPARPAGHVPGRVPGQRQPRWATAATAEARALVGRTATLVGNLTAERDRQAGLATAASEESRGHERRADGHRADATTTAALEEAAGQVETHRATVAESETAAQLASEAIETLETEASELAITLAAAGLTQQGAEKEAAGLRAQARDVTVIDTGAARDDARHAEALAHGLTVCLSRYRALREEWQAASSHSVLEAKLEGLEAQASAARARAERFVSTHDGDQAAVRALAAERAAGSTFEVCDAARVAPTPPWNVPWSLCPRHAATSTPARRPSRRLRHPATGPGTRPRKWPTPLPPKPKPKPKDWRACPPPGAPKRPG